ncbi:MAG: tRNA-dihydrouridine synthase family protein, partial [Oligoflexia bacterium]|nr:tRNA-dihydrouridine synthase family protein [Oligoflexia bacterium]
RKPQELYAFLEPIKRAISIPLTIKIRLGWSETEITAPNVIKVAEDLDISMVTIHGRTTSQLYRGSADWGMIESIAQQAQVAIVGNGDLNTPELIQERLKNTHCRALMIGRGAVKNPFIFLQGMAL